MASVTLIDNGVVSYYGFLNDNRTHSEKLMPLISECFSMMELTPQDIKAFACVTGPGSFTGLRIGIGTVQGMAYATGKKCIGVTALDALANSVVGFDGVIVPLIDARNAQAYSAIYDSKSCDKIAPDMAKEVSEIALDVKAMKRSAIFVGDGAEKNHDAIVSILGDKAHFSDEQQAYSTAKSAAFLAEQKYINGEMLEPQYLLPYYFRNTSAKKRADRR